MKSFIYIVLLAVTPLLLEAQNHLRNTGTFSHIRMTGGNLVLLNTDFDNSGSSVTATGSTSVIMRGTAATTNSGVGGTGTTQLVDLEIAKSANDVQLTGAIEVDRNVLLTQGNLNLNDFDLTLLPNNSVGHIIGESETTRIYGPTGGEIVKVVTLNAPSGYNPGFMGLTFTTPNNLGTTTIRRGHIPQTLAIDQSIERYYQVTPTNTGPAYNVALNFRYLDAELHGINEADLAMWINTTGSFWARRGVDAHDLTLENLSINTGYAIGTITLGLDALLLNTKVFLQGAYNTSLSKMNSNLAENSLVPSTEPYTALGYTGIQNMGETLTIPVASSIPNDDDIVDWVLVELRTPSSPYSIVARRAAFLRRDGLVTSDPSFFRAVTFLGVAGAANYNVAIRHRNHLGVMTSSPYYFGF